MSATFRARGYGSATFNPLDILMRHDPNVVATAQTLAAAICPTSPHAKDKFWQGYAANILTAVFLWLTDQPGESKTLARAREITSLSRREFTDKFLVPMAASEAFSGAIREMAAPFIDLADETYSGVMASLSENMKFLSDPQVKAATAMSSFDMADLTRGQTTVYVVIPTQRINTQRTWLRLMVSAAMHVFRNLEDTRSREHRCLFLIDEFPALGRLDAFPQDIATMSGFGVDFALVVQGLDQLKDHYGEAKGTILSNCAYKWFCNLNDLDSAKYLSETLGKSTVQTTSRSENYTSGTSRSESHGTNLGETGRPLLTPDEILNLGRGVAIVLQPDDDPQMVLTVNYWWLPDAFSEFQEEHPHLYWEPPLLYDDNPYFKKKPPPGGGQEQAGGSSSRQGQHGDRQRREAGGDKRRQGEQRRQEDSGRKNRDEQRKQEQQGQKKREQGDHGKQKEKSGQEDKQQKRPRRRKPQMTAAEAREILGVAEGATRDEINAAYKKLMLKVHPDLGGSKYFAQQLNAAKAARAITPATSPPLTLCKQRR